MSEVDHKSVAVIERGEAMTRVDPLAMIQSAVERGLDPDTLRQLMDLADRHAATEARKAYTQALSELKRDLPTVIERDKTVEFGNTRYTHTSLAAAMTAITEPLLLHGFDLSWRPKTDGGMVTVTCKLVHRAGHFEECTISAPPDNKGSKSAPQAIASTITLLQRYAALSLLGIATADMQEPTGEPEPGHIDTERNMRAVQAFVKSGHTKEDAEHLVNKPVAQWTVADLDVLRGWLAKRKSEQ